MVDIIMASVLMEILSRQCVRNGRKDSVDVFTATGGAASYVRR